MAYAFDRTMNSLGKQPATGKVDEPTVLASSAGDPGSGSATPNAAPVRSAPGSSKQAFSANRERAMSPVDVTGLRNRVKSAQAGLYGQQGAYLKNAGKQYDEAQAGAGANVKNYLETGGQKDDWRSQYTATPGLNAAIKLDPDKNLRDVNAIANDASIRNRIRENSGAESRLGDSALDVALLHGNLAFNQDRDTAMREYGAEEAARKDIQASSTGLANDETERKYQNYRKTIETLLGNEKNRIQVGGTNAMSAYNAAGAANASNAGTRRGLQKAALSGAGLDASGDSYDSADDKYFAPSAASTDWTQHVGADDSARWKRTMDLLGGEGPASLSGSKFGKAPGADDLGFDKNAYIRDQRSKRDAATAAAAAAEEARIKAIEEINSRAVIGSTGISEMPIPGREVRPPDTPKNWDEKVGGAVSDWTKAAGSGLSQFPSALGGSLAENAKELGRQADPSNLLPDKLKRKESVITSLRRASPKGVSF
ncbi:MAG: hypothetical protein MUP44_06455 [Anaerolineales bacterium]|nr:hypothetical protein [Anaerolineales bacterium]